MDEDEVREGIVCRVGSAQNCHGLYTFLLLEGDDALVGFRNPDLQGDAGYAGSPMAGMDVIAAVALTRPGDQVRLTWRLDKPGLVPDRRELWKFENLTLGLPASPGGR